MSKQPKPKPAGRPPGSKNVRRENVLCFPPTCPSCGRSVQVNLRTKPYRVHNYPGVLFGGQHYTRTEWRRITCECGQALAVRTPIVVESGE